MSKMRALLWIYLLAFFSVVHGQDRRPSFPYISGDTFRNYCDLIMDETSPVLDPKVVQEGDAIFLKTDMMPQFFRDVHPYIEHRYILVTHNSDDPAPREFGHILDDPKLIAWFGQNVEKCSHPKLHPIPIGLANRYWGHGNIDAVKAAQRSCRDLPRTTFLYMNFSIWTNSQERQPVYNQFKDQPFCTNVSGLDFANYLPSLAMSKFVLSPRGNGLDCHRTWEALYMGAIPVLRTSAADSLYKDLPVIIIKDWKDVTEEFLIKKWREMRFRKYKFEKMYAYYWLNLIESYKPGRTIPSSNP